MTTSGDLMEELKQLRTNTAEAIVVKRLQEKTPQTNPIPTVGATVKQWQSADGRMRLFNMDCMEFMRGCADGAYQLAVVDPPYGIGMDKTTRPSRGRTETQPHIEKHWDSKPPEQSYFTDLLRISKQQIVWGANHFISRLPLDSSCWIVWNKKTAGNTADCELAWTSFHTAVRRFDFMWEGFWQENMKHKENRIHPTQKPVALYRWLLQNYAKPGDRLLDTHVGSASSFIAAWEKGFAIDGCELDGDYFDAAVERIEKAMQQPSLPFATPPPQTKEPHRDLFS